MNSRFLRHLQLSLAILDLLAINVIIFLSESFPLRIHLSGSDFYYYSYFKAFLILSWLLVATLTKVYQERYILSFELFTRRTMHVYVFFVLVVVFSLFVIRTETISRTYVLSVLGILPFVLLVNRFVYLIIYQYFKKKDYLINRVVIIGYNHLSKKLVNYLEGDGINKEIVGYCEEYHKVKELTHYPILSDINDTLSTCKAHGVTEIYSTIAPEQNKYIYQLIQEADNNCIRFRFIPDIEFFVKKQIHVDFFNELPVVSLRQEPLEDLGNRIKKRAFDLLVSSLVILFVLSWLIPLIGLLIVLESRGPIFFIQMRSGKDNKSFPCLKFRSMKVNARANETQATRNDARITRIGKILRRTSLDEFPQFLNVFRGHMSIVGPRPHMLKHTDEYSRLIGKYMVRQLLKPGITGWAQVNGYRGETQLLSQMQKRVEYDLWYLEHWNLWLDLKVIFLTVFNTIKGEKNAY